MATGGEHNDVKAKQTYKNPIKASQQLNTLTFTHGKRSEKENEKFAHEAGNQ
jgi:hypothetical protein